MEFSRIAGAGTNGSAWMDPLHKVVDDARNPKPPLGVNQCHVPLARNFTVLLRKGKETCRYNIGPFLHMSETIPRVAVSFR